MYVYIWKLKSLSKMVLIFFFFFFFFFAESKMIFMNAVKYSPIFDKLGKLNFKRKKQIRKVSLKCGCIGLKRCHWFGLVSSLMCYRTMWIILINELFFKISRLGFTIIDFYIPS